MATDPTLTIDCRTCPVRDVHCQDCMVTALGLPLDATERRAVGAFLGAGLISASEAASARAVVERSREQAPSRWLVSRSG